ncbi:hypothetical protein FRB99_008888 [Tulasnella sp. 403]|nr:hypothetical protein FRB99_008888 [Tulasnella sp. 403]
MSSFKRRTPSNQPPPPLGTRINAATSSVREISTGIPSLDDILGGGQPLGSVLALLTPDPHSSWGELLLRYWVAQGIASQQRVCLVGDEKRSRELVDGCMWLAPSSIPESGAPEIHGDEDDPEEKSNPESGDESKVKIAWRYESMKKFETTVAAARTEEYTHTFDLTQKIPDEVVNKAYEAEQLLTIEISQPGDQTVYSDVLRQIKAMILRFGQSDEDTASTRQRILRLALPDFGGSYWGDGSVTEILRFLYVVRSLVQATPVTILVVLPPQLSVSPTLHGVDDGWIAKIGHVVDACITFASFGLDPTLASTFPRYHGFVHIHRTPSIHSLAPPSHKLSILRGLSSPSSYSGGGGENNLGFRCTRKRFVIETLHLDVEGGVSERRTAPPSSAGVHKRLNVQGSERPQERAKGQETARVGVEVPTSTGPVIEQPPTEKQKKPRKVVAFRSEGRDLYDF